MGKTSDWGGIRIRQEVIDTVNDFLKSENGKGLGFSSASQLAEFVLRNYINNPDLTNTIEDLKKRFEHLHRTVPANVGDKIKTLEKENQKLEEKIKELKIDNKVIAQLQESQKEHDERLMYFESSLTATQKGTSDVLKSRAKVKAIKLKKIPNSS